MKKSDDINAINDAIRGSLIGGAAGDALGYPVEFDRLRDIYKMYGNNGIQHYELSENGAALLSDDTQMTLFTAMGLISCMTGEDDAEAAERNTEAEERIAGAGECIAETPECIAENEGSAAETPARIAETPEYTVGSIPEMVWRSYRAWYELQTGQMASPIRLES